MKLRASSVWLVLACVAAFLSLVWLDPRHVWLLIAALWLGAIETYAVSRIWTWSDES